MNKESIDYIELVEKKFKFLTVELGYEIIDKEDSVLWKYVRYRNTDRRRLISINVDLRENYFDVTLWRLTDLGEEFDSNSIDLAELIIKKQVKEKLIPLPSKAAQKNISHKVVNEMLDRCVSILRKYFLKLISGDDWY